MCFVQERLRQTFVCGISEDDAHSVAHEGVERCRIHGAARSRQTQGSWMIGHKNSRASLLLLTTRLEAAHACGSPSSARPPASVRRVVVVRTADGRGDVRFISLKMPWC